MTKRLNKIGAIAACAIAVAVPTGAQDMSAADRALLEQMMRNAGMDPEQVKAASAQFQKAQQFGDVVRYSVVGVYQSRTNVSADQNWIAYADVTDRVEMQFEWKTSEARLVSSAALQNGKSTLANPRNWEAKCAPPKVNGPFEYDLKSIEQGIGGTIRLHFQTSFPPVQVHQFCTGALKAIAPKQTSVTHEFMVPPPTMLGMSLPPNGDVTLSQDGKSLVHKKDGWTWTFTPRAR
jgi:hypothetical protein